MATILIAEDEKPISELIKRNLNLVGYSTHQTYTASEVLSCIEKHNIDLILLDVMLPEMNGFEIKKLLPQDMPVIFVTAKVGLPSRLTGLGLGADDYIEKPFEILELIARIQAVLRRTHKSEEIFKINDCTVDIQTYRVYVKGEEVLLTPQEFNLLCVLIRNRNLALSREKLLELAWGYDYEGDTRTVDVHIQKLRKKLGLEDCIQTVFKMGYRLVQSNMVVPYES